MIKVSSNIMWMLCVHYVHFGRFRFFNVFTQLTYTSLQKAQICCLTKQFRQKYSHWKF